MSKVREMVAESLINLSKKIYPYAGMKSFYSNIKNRQSESPSIIVKGLFVDTKKAC